MASSTEFEIEETLLRGPFKYRLNIKLALQFGDPAIVIARGAAVDFRVALPGELTANMNLVIIGDG